MNRLMLTIPCAVFAAVISPHTALTQEPPEELTGEQRTELETEADRLFEEVVNQYRAGKPAEALKFQQQELKLRLKLHGSDDHINVARSLNAVSFFLMTLGRDEEALPFTRDALEMTRRLYNQQDHPAVSVSLNNMGSLLQSMGRYEEALPLHTEALEMRRRLYEGTDHPLLATSLNNIGALLDLMGRYDEALTHHEEAMAMRRRLFKGRDHPDLAQSFNNMATLFSSLGRQEEALSHYQSALTMTKSLFEDRDHPYLMMSLGNVASQLAKMCRYEEALPYQQDALAMSKRLHKGQDHPSLVVSLSNLGSLFGKMGRYEKGLPYLRDAVAMSKRLHMGRDHPDLAKILNIMGLQLESMGQREKALSYHRESLEMYRRLYKDQDHPDFVVAMTNMGALLGVMGPDEKALPFHRDALAMSRRLYKGQDHPRLALTLNNFGHLLGNMGRYEDALPYLRDALAMLRRLHDGRDHRDLGFSADNICTILLAMGRFEEAIPFAREAVAIKGRLYQGQDHPQSAFSMEQVGQALCGLGRYEESLPFWRDALAMKQRYADREAASASLAEGLALMRTYPAPRSGLLAASAMIPEGDDVLGDIWAKKASLARLLRERHRLARLQQSESEEIRDQVQRLHAHRRRLTALLQQPSSPERDRELRELTDAAEKLERSLAAIQPKQRELAELKLSDLSAALKDGQVFVDLYRYGDRVTDLKNPPSRYVAFVLNADGKPKRVELGPAEPIEEAVVAWRRAIFSWSKQLSPSARTDIERKTAEHGATLRELVWGPIEKHLPRKPTAVYVCCDEDLGRLPFAALPGEKPGTVLVEDYPVAVVPSGPFLLEHLTDTAKRAEESIVLLAGGIDYGKAEIGEWESLEGTAREFAQVNALAGERRVIAEQGTEATADWLLNHLPNARFAHLATHGEFREREYAEERIRLAEALQHQIGGLSPNMLADGRPGAGIVAGAGVRHPLGYVGLVMAGANTSEGGIASGLDVMNLDLSGMELAVLSACETGLGEHTGGVGVSNLQLAFHLAGCRNVVASLWKVDDEATAALMAKFYHELWVEKKPPIEALRRAQLLVYRRPDLIPDLAGTRGAPKRKQAVQIDPTEAPPAGRPEDLPERTPPKFWAAFVLSGVGR